MTEETMNAEVVEEVETDETSEPMCCEESNYEIEYEVASGPSKGFIALCVGGIAAAAVGVVVAINKHKNKKKIKSLERDIANADYVDDDEEDEETDDPIETEAAPVVEDSEEKPVKKKRR